MYIFYKEKLDSECSPTQEMEILSKLLVESFSNEKPPPNPIILLKAGVFFNVTREETSKFEEPVLRKFSLGRVLGVRRLDCFSTPRDGMPRETTPREAGFRVANLVYGSKELDVTAGPLTD